MDFGNVGLYAVILVCLEDACVDHLTESRQTYPHRRLKHHRYGYAFAAARAGVWHRSATDFMFYPSYMPADIPHVIHYGLKFQLDGWEFDKHFYIGFDPLKCPPWSDWQGYEAPRLRGLAGDALAAARLAGPPRPAVTHPQEGIFPPPPHPARILNDTSKPYLARYRDLLSIFTVAQINAALCEFHSATCSWSAQLEAVCGDVWELYLDVREAVDEIEFTWGCADHDRECASRAKSGDCERRASYMAEHCARSCHRCVSSQSGEFVARKRRSLMFAGWSPRQQHASAVNTYQATNKKKKTSQNREAFDVQSAIVRASGSLTQLAGPDIISLVRRCSNAFEPPLIDSELGLCVRAANIGLSYMRSRQPISAMRANDPFDINGASSHIHASWLVLGLTAGSAIAFIGWQALSRRIRVLMRDIMRACRPVRIIGGRLGKAREFSSRENCACLP